MLVEHSIELDLPNQGNRLVEPVASMHFARLPLYFDHPAYPDQFCKGSHHALFSVGCTVLVAGSDIGPKVLDIMLGH
jgi:hypothetical protein